MNRHFFISDDLNDLEMVEKELEDQGVGMPQIHVLTKDEAGAEQHHLHQVPSLVKNNVVRSTFKAAIFGVLGAIAVLVIAHFSGITETIGWVPFAFLALIVLGFITWEGGMWGIQEPNAKFKRFDKALKEGKHVLYVEVKKDSQEERVLKDVTGRHPRLEQAGVEDAATDLLVGAENLALKFAKWGP